MRAQVSGKGRGSGAETFLAEETACGKVQRGNTRVFAKLRHLVQMSYGGEPLALVASRLSLTVVKDQSHGSPISYFSM